MLLLRLAHCRWIGRCSCHVGCRWRQCCRCVRGRILASRCRLAASESAHASRERGWGSHGGGAPCVVQSMLNAPADDVEANLRQIRALEAAGCEVVRMAIPRRAYLDQFAEVCAKSPLPVVADVHFDAGIAIEAARRGAAKLRINPGNIGGWEKTDEVIEAARAAHIPIRVGVNAGSLDDALKARADLTLPEKLAASAVEYVRHFEQRDFGDVVVSAKAHDVQATIAPTARSRRKFRRCRCISALPKQARSCRVSLNRLAAWAFF